MKEKAALVIAAIMMTSIATMALSTGVSSSPGVTVSPERVQYNTRVAITITVTNEVGENIENVRIDICGDPTPAFSEAIGGMLAAENLKLAADNMENAVNPLKQAGENLKRAAENLSNAASALQSAAAQIDTAVTKLTVLGWENVPNLMDQFSTYLEYAGDNLAASSENFTTIVDMLENAAYYLNLAGGWDTGTENFANYNTYAAENIDNAVSGLENVAANLENGSLKEAGENLIIAGNYLENAGEKLTDNNTDLGTAIKAAGAQLRSAGSNLVAAATYENNAGTNLKDAAAYLLSAGNYIGLADDNLDAAGDNIENAAELMENIGDNLLIPNDNLFVGENLTQVATYLANAASELGSALGGTEMTTVATNENAAGENMSKETVNLTNAGNSLIAAANALSEAASKLLSTANSLGPTGWTLTEIANNKIRFDVIGENDLIPGDSKPFTFMWRTPNCSGVDNVYTIKVWVYTSGQSVPAAAYEVTLTVDGTTPTATILVTQTGVSENNVVGKVYNDGKATITITASEELSSIGTVYIETSSGDNLLPPISASDLTTADNIVFTYEFTVGAWDDNFPQVRISSIKDLMGNENTSITQTFTVDTRAPILIDNALAGLAALPTKVQPGTTNTYRVDNTAKWTLIGRAEDNIDAADNAKWCTVYINGELADKDPDENFFKVITLQQGLNSITVKAVDRVGNETSVTLENIFIDSTKPTVSLTTLAGKTFTENMKINDNTPTIVLSILDPGYPSTGFGVPYENILVRLLYDNGDLVAVLDNAAPWDPSTGSFENTYPTALADGWYRIEVQASDNINENTAENFRFYIDTVVPSKPTLLTSYPTSTADKPKALNTAEIVLSGTCEAGATVRVYTSVSPWITPTLAAEVTDSDGDGEWFTSVTVSAGVTTKIEVSQVDVAGNESEKALYGYVKVDATPPTISEVTIDGKAVTSLSTSKSSVIVSGKVTDDVSEPTEIELRISYGDTSITVPLEADGSFSKSIRVFEGSNVITLIATDAAGNTSPAISLTVERTVTPTGTYAIILVIIALVLAAIAILRVKK